MVGSWTKEELHPFRGNALRKSVISPMKINWKSASPLNTFQVCCALPWWAPHGVERTFRNESAAQRANYASRGRWRWPPAGPKHRWVPQHRARLQSFLGCRFQDSTLGVQPWLSFFQNLVALHQSSIAQNKSSNSMNEPTILRKCSVTEHQRICVCLCALSLYKGLQKSSFSKKQ